MELGVLLLLLLCFPGFQAQTPAAEERRWEGSSLSVHCPYPVYVTQQQKAWCRMAEGHWNPLLETSYHTYSQTSWLHSGDVRLKDSQASQALDVVMSNLQAEHSGTYACAYRAYYSSSRYQPIKTISLNVFKEVHRWELDSLSLQCTYDALLRSLPRAWCRRGPSGCKTWFKVNYPSTRSNSKTLEDRALIQDDFQKRTLTITIQKLQVRDTGTYWCVVSRDSQHTRLLEVRLSVSKRTQQHMATESGSLSVQCLYNALAYGAVSKAWCKEGAKKPCTVLADTSGDSRTPEGGRVITIRDDTKQGVVTVTMEQLQAQDSGVYWCALQEAGQLLRVAEVTLNIPQVSPGTTSSTPGIFQSTPSDNTSVPRSNEMTFIILSGLLSILLLLALSSSITLYIKWHKQLERRGNRTTQDIYEKPEDTAQLDSTERMESHNDDSKDLKYAALRFPTQLSPQDTLYCNVEPRQAPRKARGEAMDYAIIPLRHVPTNGQG